MDLAVLNWDPSKPNFLLPGRLVENHSSLIWSERYSSNGDFERVSADVGGTMAQLPLYNVGSDGIQRPTIVTLRDSTVPMVVEAHKIDKTLTGAAQITTTGRSVETWLDRRTNITSPVIEGNPLTPFTDTTKTAVAFAAEVIKKIINDGSSSSLDIIPELSFVDGSGNPRVLRPVGYDESTITATTRTADFGELYSWAIDQITSEGYGLRAVRPSDPSYSKINLEIYKGRDRTILNSYGNAVVFDARFDQFTDSSYLLSQAAWKNVDQVVGANDCWEYEAPHSGAAPSGLNRRVAYLDASQTATGPAGDATNIQIMSNLAQVDLAKQLQTVLFSGEVGRLKGSIYGKDFLLGDIVKLTGDYGLSQFVRIAEFIRSEDSSGEKAYPTFESL